jgi:hypothetical protein
MGGGMGAFFVLVLADSNIGRKIHPTGIEMPSKFSQYLGQFCLELQNKNIIFI